MRCFQTLGWATEVVAGVEEDGHGQNTACSLFSVTVTLTEGGMAAGPGLGLGPVALVFQYLALLASQSEREGGECGKRREREAFKKGVTAIGVTAIGVTAIRVTAIGADFFLLYVMRLCSLGLSPHAPRALIAL